MNNYNKVLVTREFIGTLKQISKSVSLDILNPHIVSAQRTEVQPLIGEELFNDILNDTASYTDLLEGGSYTVDGKTYENYGLKTVIALYAHARYIYFGSAVDTPFSLVQKNNGNNSTPVSESAKKSVYIESQKEAFVAFQSVRDFLIRTDVELYTNCFCKQTSAPGGGFSKMTTIY